MNRMLKKAGVVSISLFMAVFLCAFFGLATDSRAEPLTQDQIQGIISTSLQLLIKGEEPNDQQNQGIQSLDAMLKNGEISKEDIHRMVKEQLFTDMEKQEVSRYVIGDMVKRSPEILPSVAGKDLHNMLWEKIKGMLDKPVIIKVGTLAPEGTAWLEFPKKKLNPYVRKVSGGKVITKMYTGGVMGEDSDILRKMDMGQLDGCGCTALGFFKAAPEMSVFSLPRLFRNYDEVDYILKKFRKEIDASFEKKGYEVQTLIDTGFFYMWTRNEVSSLDDLRKQKVLSWFGTVENTTYDELGIHPTPVSVTEVVTSLNTGMVNANCGPAPWLLGTQSYTNVHYYISQPFFYSPAAVILSSKVKDQFRGKYPDALVDNFMELVIYETDTMEREWVVDNIRPYESRCIKAFHKYGIKPVTFNKQDMATIDAASKRVWNKLADGLYPRDLLDRVLKELEAYRQSH